MVGPQEIELTRNSYYEASVTRPPASAPLVGRITADVCVVGGGYAGLSAALELAERGYSVALLEAQRVGWGGFRQERRPGPGRFRFRRPGGDRGAIVRRGCAPRLGYLG